MTTELWQQNMGNMGFSKTKIWLKYGILGEFATEIWDKYGKFVRISTISKCHNCLHQPYVVSNTTTWGVCVCVFRGGYDVKFLILSKRYIILQAFSYKNHFLKEGWILVLYSIFKDVGPETENLPFQTIFQMSNIMIL